MSEFVALINEIKSLSVQLLTLAQEGDWDGFSSLQKQRDALLAQALENPADTKESPVARKLLLEIVDIDTQLMALAQASREEALGNISVQATRTKAINAYKGV